MRKMVFVIAAVGVAAVLVAGGLVASNMGFKANHALYGPTEITPDPLIPGGVGPGPSNSGAQSIALPYFQQTNILTAQDLINDMNADAGGTLVVNVSRRLRTTDGLQPYSLVTGGTNFAITPGEGYFVTVSAGFSYIAVGSHNPGLGVNFDAFPTNGSNSGTNVWSMPYHFTGTTATDLINDIEAHAGVGAVANVSRSLRTTDGLEPYSLVTGGTDFLLSPGQAYNIVINVGNDVVGWIPSHY